MLFLLQGRNYALTPEALTTLSNGVSKGNAR